MTTIQRAVDPPSLPSSDPCLTISAREDRGTRTSRLVAEWADAADDESRDLIIARVIETNLPVAEAIARRYRHRGVPEEDLRQVAYLALTKAAQRFDPTAGHDFLSYAVPSMRGEVRRYFRDHGWMVRPTRTVQELQSRITAVQPELSTLLGRSPTISELAEHLGESRDDVGEALAAEGCFTPASLDAPVGADGQGTLADLLGGVDGDHDADEARVMLAPLIRRLSDRDRTILRLRYFEQRTQRDIAGEIGVTQTQVSRLLTRILNELRDELTAKEGSGPREPALPA